MSDENQVTSEGYVGSGKPTDNRITSNQAREALLLYESKIKSTSPAAWDKIEIMLERLAELEEGQNVPRRETLVVETSKKVPIYAVSPRVIQALGRLAADSIANALEDSRNLNEPLTADGAALDMIEIVLVLAYERLSDVTNQCKQSGDDA